MKNGGKGLKGKCRKGLGVGSSAETRHAEMEG